MTETEIEVEWQPNGLPAKWVHGGETYEYAQNSRTVLPLKHYGYSDWGGMRGQEYFYDEHFDLVKSSLDIGDEQFGLHYNDFTDYTYDKYGNWTPVEDTDTHNAKATTVKNFLSLSPSAIPIHILQIVYKILTTLLFFLFVLGKFCRSPVT